MIGQFSVVVSLKGNPFVKVAPTTKYFKVIENTDTKVNLRVLNKVTNVPYCDSFAVEEDWLILSPSPTANCCMVRMMV